MEHERQGHRIKWKQGNSITTQRTEIVGRYSNRKSKGDAKYEAEYNVGIKDHLKKYMPLKKDYINRKYE